MKIIAIIPARGGSKRLPDKNLRLVNGKRMLVWAIEACQDSKYPIEVWVSSEDKRILSLARINGARTIERDVTLADDNVPKQAVIRDAVRRIKNLDSGDIVISLQANSPQVTGSDLDSAIAKLLAFKCNEIFSVDINLMQNGAFRVMKRDYVFQESLSTHCGCIICNVVDIHTSDDLENAEITWKL